MAYFSVKFPAKLLKGPEGKNVFLHQRACHCHIGRKVSDLLTSFDDKGKCPKDDSDEVKKCTETEDSQQNVITLHSGSDENKDTDHFASTRIRC